jgi:hypothetical protein
MEVKEHKREKEEGKRSKERSRKEGINQLRKGRMETEECVYVCVSMDI